MEPSTAPSPDDLEAADDPTPEAEQEPFADDAAPRGRTSRRAVLAWTIGAASAVAVIAGAVYVHVEAVNSFEASSTSMAAAVEAATDSWWSLDATRSAVAASVVSAEQIVADAADPLVDATTRDALDAAASAASDSVDAAAALVDAGYDEGDIDDPFWTWQMWEATAELEQRGEAAAALVDEMAVAEAAVESADTVLLESALALYGSVEKAARSIEQRNVSARSTAVLDFRDAASEVVTQTDVGSQAALAVSTYAHRLRQLTESNAAELAEKAGPLSATRLEIEAFARSISGGVVLDFDWAPVVNGMGGAAGIGGLASWDTARGGFSTITLSNSVAEWWPAADARALVAHEVGHAITAKCHTKFDWESADANEEWATAWAISMGHTAVGNGVQAYGYPSQGMIDKAATCR
ncbi:hypothetical protein [Microbacterium sulfonylureivorans]|uniref:hypothetical protein n=1 Tax=Microbacterium sulfonylureivorans TaxID=2486854 RepID=UPI000FDC0B04|nr:hypothetical protein [Microbacterium sulfonylureivorans]